MSGGGGGESSAGSGSSTGLLRISPAQWSKIEKRGADGGGGACTACPQEAPPEDHKITIGAHTDGPDDWIGHAFVSVEGPGGADKETKGFWPRDGFDLSDPDDRRGVVLGMPGAVLDDSEYLLKKGSSLKSFAITREEAARARAVIDAWEANPPEYTLHSNQCATFAVAVLEATGNEIDAGYLIARPSVLKQTIDAEQAAGSSGVAGSSSSRKGSKP